MPPFPGLSGRVFEILGLAEKELAARGAPRPGPQVPMVPVAPSKMPKIAPTAPEAAPGAPRAPSPPTVAPDPALAEAAKAPPFAPTDPRLVGRAAGRMNLDYLDIDVAGKSLAVRMQEMYPAEFSRQARGVTTHVEQYRQAAAHPYPLAKTLELQPGDVLKPADALSVRMQAATLGRVLQENATRLTPDAAARLAGLYRVVSAKDVALGSELGLALNLRQVSVGAAAGTEALDAAIAMFADIPAEAKVPLSEILRTLPRLEQKRAFISNLSRGGNGLVNAYMAGLMQSPRTIAANMKGNLGRYFWDIGQTAVAGQVTRAMDVLGMDTAGRIVPGEATAKLYSQYASFWDAVRVGKESFMENRPAFWGTAAEKSAPATSTFAPLRWLANAWNYAGRANLGADQYAAGINWYGQAYAVGIRRAAAAGLLAPDKDPHLAAEMIANLFERGLDKAARQEIEGTTLQNIYQDPLSGFGKWWADAVRETPQLRFVQAFTQVPDAMNRFAVQNTPLLQFASRRLREELGWVDGVPTTPVKRGMAEAKVLTAGVLASTVAMLAHTGRITGNGPREPGARAIWLETHQPRSYWSDADGKWKSMDGWEPFALPVVAVADAYHAYASSDHPDALTLAAAVGHGWVEGIANSAWFEGVTNLIQALTDDKSQPDKVYKLWRNRVGSAVPGALRWSKEVADPIFYESNDVRDEVFRKIPGFSGDLVPHVTFYGQDSELEGRGFPGFLSRSKHKTPTDDPFLQELRRLHVNPPVREAVIFGSKDPMNPLRRVWPEDLGVPLSPAEQYWREKRARGERIVEGKDLRTYGNDFVASDTYKALPSDKAKAGALLDVYNAFWQQSRVDLLLKSPYAADLQAEAARRFTTKARSVDPGAPAIPGDFLQGVTAAP